MAMRSFFLLLSSVFLVSAQAVAASYSFKPSEIERVSVVGFKGPIEVIGSGSEEMKIELTAVNAQAPNEVNWKWTPTLRRVENIVEIRIDGPESKGDWQKLISQAKWPEYRLRVTGAGIPLQIFWREGSANLNQWPVAAEVHLTQGRVTSRGGKGLLKTSLQQGEVTVQDHTGPVEVSGFQANTKIQKTKGDVLVRGSRGNIEISESEGNINFDNDQGRSVVKNIKGSLSFNNGKGQVEISSVAGGIHGKNGTGSLELVYRSGGEVQLDSTLGQVTVRVPKEAAPNVELVSVEGDIYVPNYINVVTSSSQKRARGRLRGSDREGTIRVSSEKGDVYLR